LRPDTKVTDLLVLSQVVLAIQLPFAMFPLLHVTSSRRWMGDHKTGWFLVVVGWASALLITAMVIYGLPEAAGKAWNVIVGAESGVFRSGWSNVRTEPESPTRARPSLASGSVCPVTSYPCRSLA